jgi:hypothetical protein
MLKNELKLLLLKKRYILETGAGQVRKVKIDSYLLRLITIPFWQEHGITFSLCFLRLCL